MPDIRPQKGPQEDFLSSSADIVFYGGSAGGGKTFGLLMEVVRHIGNPEYGAVIFRRTTPQIKNEGGLWDESEKLYPLLGGVPTAHNLLWKFPQGSKVKFAHLEYDKNVLDYQGAQIPVMGFDEITHFTRKQFLYMLSRNRSTCGISPYVRATCNPDPESFVADWIEWWIDQDTGYAILERSGVIRHFVIYNDSVIWGATREELLEQYPDLLPLSFTFIPASIDDNQELIRKDPTYKAKLDALGTVDRERLKFGNWKIKASAGLMFRRDMFEIIDRNELPINRTEVRGWDIAATEKTEANDPDATAGVKMSQGNGFFYVEDLVHFCGSPLKVDNSIKNTASQDGKKTKIRLPQDPGQAGKAQAKHFSDMLIGYLFKILPVSGDKVTRASAFSAQCEHGNVKVVRAPWNEAFFSELAMFPEGAHDDIVDAASDAFNELAPAKSKFMVS